MSTGPLGTQMDLSGVNGKGFYLAIKNGKGKKRE
jgi:hypothetical protein